MATKKNYLIKSFFLTKPLKNIALGTLFLIVSSQVFGVIGLSLLILIYHG